MSGRGQWDAHNSGDESMNSGPLAVGEKRKIVKRIKILGGLRKYCLLCTGLAFGVGIIGSRVLSIGEQVGAAAIIAFAVCLAMTFVLQIVLSILVSPTLLRDREIAAAGESGAKQVGGWHTRPSLYEKYLLYFRAVRIIRSVGVLAVFAAVVVIIAGGILFNASSAMRLWAFVFATAVFFAVLLLQGKIWNMAKSPMPELWPYSDTPPDFRGRDNCSFIEWKLDGSTESMRLFVFLGIAGFLLSFAAGVRSIVEILGYSLAPCAVLLIWRLVGRFGRISFFEQGVLFETYTAAKWGRGKAKFVHYDALSLRSSFFTSSVELLENGQRFGSLRMGDCSPSLKTEFMARLAPSKHEFWNDHRKLIHGENEADAEVEQL